MYQGLVNALVFFLSFSGIGVGMLLARISPEEMEPGEKYFRFLRIAAIVLIAAIFLAVFQHQRLLVAVGLVAALCALKWPDSRIIFGTYGIYLAAAAWQGSLGLFTSLVFLAGLPEGTLFWHQVRKFTLLPKNYWPLLLAFAYHFTSLMPR